MSIFNIDFRTLFSQSQTPRKRNAQTLDLGDSLTSTLQTDADAVAALNDTLQIEKKYNCVKMVFEASLDEIFTETTFEVETELSIIIFNYFFTEIEAQKIYFFKETEQTAVYLFTEAEIPFDASIIIHVPAGLFSSSLDLVKSEAEKIKVAGKSIKYVSL